MSRCAIRRPLILTEKAACALILLVVSGCAVFENAKSFTSLLQADGVSADEFEQPKTRSNVADRPRPDPQMDPGERESAAAFDEPSAPAARLLNPEFDPLDTPQIDDSAGGHIFLRNGPSNPGSMYPTTVRPTTQTRDLFDGPTDREPHPSEGASVESLDRRIDATAISRPLIAAGLGAQSISEGIKPDSIRNGIPPEARRSPLPPEPSVFDRLRRAPRIRPFERIPNPFQLDWFGPKDSVAPSSPQQQPATPGMRSLPTTAELIDAAADAASLLEALIAKQEQELKTWAETDGGSLFEPDELRRRHLNLRLLRLISDQPAAAAEAIDSMSPEEQKFWQELVMAIAIFRDPDEDIDYGEHIAATMGQFHTAVRQLEPLSSLSIRRLEFCSKISGFGSFDTFHPNIFEPGERLMIYAEVDNMESEVSPLDVYRTSISGTLQIWSRTSGEPIEPSLELPKSSDESTTRRLDYYLSTEFNVPATLPDGEYEIRLQIRDEISGRTADERQEFAVQ